MSKIPSESANSQNCKKSLSRLLLVTGALLCLAGILFLPFDVSISQNFAGPKELRIKIPGDLRTLVELSEIFAHGTGILLIATTIYVFDKRDWRIGPIAFGTALASGIMANVIKITTVIRFRPREYFQIEPLPESTFDTLCPLLNSGGIEPLFTYLKNDGLHSFPSGHAATAAGLWVAMILIYPRATWFLSLLAVLSCFQRVMVGAHFPSDVCFGAITGIITGYFILSWKPLQLLIEGLSVKGQTTTLNFDEEKEEFADSKT